MIGAIFIAVLIIYCEKLFMIPIETSIEALVGHVPWSESIQKSPVSIQASIAGRSLHIRALVDCKVGSSLLHTILGESAPAGLESKEAILDDWPLPDRKGEAFLLAIHDPHEPEWGHFRFGWRTFLNTRSQFMSVLSSYKDQGVRDSMGGLATARPTDVSTFLVDWYNRNRRISLSGNQRKLWKKSGLLNGPHGNWSQWEPQLLSRFYNDSCENFGINPEEGVVFRPAMEWTTEENGKRTWVYDSKEESGNSLLGAVLTTSLTGTKSQWPEKVRLPRARYAQRIGGAQVPVMVPMMEKTWIDNAPILKAIEERITE